ncbi:MAG: hypothetical protein P1V97_29075 [Planctomycetota bacterium]|nr:hypothetical protein [Planctomycetota bacterium]
MVSPQLLEELSKLPRGDKLRVMQVLLAQMSKEEELEEIVVPGATYEISSFYNCSEAATQLQELLEQQNKNG